MKKSIMTINVSDRPPSHSRRRRRRLRLSRKGKNRLLFLLVLAVLFGLSCGITTLVASRPETGSEPVADLPETEHIPVVAPKPVSDPTLPTIVTVKEEEPEETLPEGEVGGEDPNSEAPAEPNEETMGEEGVGETTLPNEGTGEPPVEAPVTEAPDVAEPVVEETL